MVSLKSALNSQQHTTKNMRFLYKLSFFVIIDHLIAFNPKI
jgi:hypothetical protein